MSDYRKTSFVAASLIAPSAPPTSERGVIRWLRENLFNGFTNSLFTLISIAAILLLMLPVVDWAFFKGVWNATSFEECRQIVIAVHGEAAHGACWAFLNDRLELLVFGFYPPDLYWRPIVAFILLLVALAPILINRLPRRLLWFSAIYPFVGYALIWGSPSRQTKI
ncbi:MAG: hypothetical protein OEN23_02930 [Paracoccaceae bacterium]|nr:hypothetical protein [Paracoccaceae bacterium]